MSGHWKALLAAAAATAGLVAIGSSAPATPASGFNAAQTFKGVFGPIEAGVERDDFELELKTKGTADLYVVRNEVQPGGTSGWHTHPGPSLITVTAGEITAYESTDPDCAPTVYTAGQGFVDHGDHAHMLRNETDSLAETVAVQFLPTGAGRRVDQPKPGHC